MTSTNNQRLEQASGQSRRLLALLVGLLATLALIVSGTGPAAAQNAIGPQPQNLIFTIRPQSVAALEAVGLHGVPQLRLVSATGVAAEPAANEGIYVIRSDRGTYVGQSGKISPRFTQHLVDKGGRFTEAELDAAERIGVLGGKTAREIAEQQKIDELGGIDALLNVRNPIGQGRVSLMPQPYSTA